MPTNIWKSFQGLLPSQTRIIVTVNQHNSDGTSSATTASGSPVRLWGQLEDETPPYQAFAQGGKLERKAPQLPHSELTV